MLRYGGLLGLSSLLLGCSTFANNRREADVKAIEELEASWAKDIKAKNLERWVNYYVEYGSILLPNSPPVTGRDNIRAALQARVADPNYSLVFRPSKIEVSDDLAYSQGNYEITRTDRKTREPVS